MLEILIVGVIVALIIIYRRQEGARVYKYIIDKASNTYNKYAPYTFKEVHQKTKELGLEYTPKQYTTQILIMGIAAFVISYLYFYNIIISVIYVIAAILFVPYLALLRTKKNYSEYLFEQVQVYTTNVIMEFETVKSFVKALEGVYASGVLEEPVSSDVKVMIDLAYQNGSIDASIDYMNNKYNYYVLKNMHQLFLQITKEGSKDSEGSLENMLNDIDMLVESVYRDRVDRATFHRQFIQFGVMLYILIMLIQLILGAETYNDMLGLWYVNIMLHAIILINSYFLVNGEKYYCENVGAE